MIATLGESAYSVKANLHTVCGYALSVPNQPLQKVVAANVKAVRQANKQTQPQVAQTARNRGYTLDQGTVSRVERGELCPSIDVLEAIAKGLEVQPWQLLVTPFDPSNPPLLREATEAERDLWRKITDSARELGLIDEKEAVPAVKRE